MYGLKLGFRENPSASAEHQFSSLLGFIATNSHVHFYFSVEVCKTRKGKKKKRQFYSAIITVPVNNFTCSAPYCGGAHFLLGEFLTCMKEEKEV